MIAALALIPFTVAASVAAWRYIDLHFERISLKEREEHLTRVHERTTKANEENLEAAKALRRAINGDPARLAVVAPLNPKPPAA